MSLTVINIYLCANALLIVAVLLLSAVKLASRRTPRPIAYQHLLWIGYGLTLAALLLPLIRLSMAHDVMPATLQVWSAPSMHSAETTFKDHRISMPLASVDASVSWSTVEDVAVFLFAAGTIALLLRVVIAAVLITRIVGSAQTLRRLRSSKLLVSDRVRVPFSVWTPGSRIIVIPSALLLRSNELRMAIRHEMQHHRQQDTLWLYLYPLIKALFFWNPAAHLLARRIQELQEFACDAAVISRRGISARSYCHSLVWVAEQSIDSTPIQLSASMIGSSRKLLKRRVDALLTRPRQYLRNAWVLSISIIAMSLMAVVATVSASTIRDRRISYDEATRMAAATPPGGIPIQVNDAVVAQLNRLLGTPDGREYLHTSLERMQQYKEMIATKIAARELPMDLLAIPLVESAYRNLQQSKNARHGAGLWMFIIPTAQSFGLKVNDHQDQRLDPEAETDAALRMFATLYSRYGDWGLALLAYNCGSACVDNGVNETGSHDVWAIIANRHENDPNYVARAMAVMLILRTTSPLNL